MSETTFPGEVTTEHTPRGVRFVFPRRSGALRVRGLIGTLVFMVIITAFAGVFWVAALLSPAGDRAVPILNAVIVTLGVLGLIGLILWGAFGHSEIAIEGGQVVASERAGTRLWVHRQPLRLLCRLEITTRTFWLGGNGGQESSARNQRELRYALRGHFTLYGPVVLAHGYPRAMLETVAVALTDLAEAARASAGPRPEGAVMSHPRIAVAFDQDREPPRPETRYVCVSDDRGTLRFDFLPHGGAGCHILFGVAFAGIPGTAIVLHVCTHGVQTVGDWLTLVIPVLFTLFGVAMIVIVLRWRNRPSGSLKVTAGTVQATEPGPWKYRERSWRRVELAAVRNFRDSDGDSWLQLDLADGKQVQLFASVRGLDWVAWRLRQALQLPEVPP